MYYKKMSKSKSIKANLLPAVHHCKPEGITVQTCNASFMLVHTSMNESLQNRTDQN